MPRRNLDFLIAYDENDNIIASDDSVKGLANKLELPEETVRYYMRKPKTKKSKLIIIGLEVENE